MTLPAETLTVLAASAEWLALIVYWPGRTKNRYLSRPRGPVPAAVR
jgi:hypothetical protein